MRIRLTLLILLTCSFVRAQSLANENLAHLYDSENEIAFNWNMVKEGGKMNISYSFSSIGQNNSPEMFIMEWEERDSYSQRQGKSIKLDSILLSPDKQKKGDFTVDLKDSPWLLLLKITKVTSSKNWSYPFLIENNYPVNGYIKEGGEKILNPFLKIGRTYTIEGPSDKTNLYVYYYTSGFLSAFPPFSKNTAGADPLLLPDSTFSIVNGTGISFSKEGLYLVQSDTSSTEGFAFRVYSGSYPKYTRIEDLVEPLVFICTKEEFSKLQQANEDKIQFDKTILGITRDKDRAKRFIKSYYYRVELANKYFSSYKEGWKTDMGMIFMIFGLPDEVRKTGQNEIWYYKGSRTKFVFIRKGSVYDPNYTTMMRDNRFTELWYNAIDLWRRGRI